MKNRNLGLDVLRGLAMLLVLFHHLDAEHVQRVLLFSAPLVMVQRSGHIGVHLFFVLSGFLVTSLLLREWKEHGGVHIGRFLARRGWKIYPSYYVFIIASYLVLGWEDKTVFQMAGDAFFLQNYLDSAWPHTWSLAVEEHFYLLLAGAFGLASYFKKVDLFARYLPVVGLAYCATATLVKLQSDHLLPPGGGLHLYTHNVIDGLIYGAVIASLWCFHEDRLGTFLKRYWFIIAPLTVAMLLPSFVIPVIGGGIFPGLYSVNYLAFGNLLLLSLLLPDQSVVTSSTLKPVVRISLAGLAWLGRYSYSPKLSDS